MSDFSKNIWYHVGYALERARAPAPRVRRALSERKVSQRPSTADHPLSSSAVDRLLAAGGGALAHKGIVALSGGRPPGTLRLARAALAGAGAAFLLGLLRPRSGPAGAEEAPVDPTLELLAGSGRGILYGSLLEPHLFGSPVVRGVTFGIVEYMVSPFGGLDGVLGSASPTRSMPVLSALLGTDAAPGESLTRHIAFGAALGVLYGEGRARRGKSEAE